MKAQTKSNNLCVHFFNNLNTLEFIGEEYKRYMEFEHHFILEITMSGNQ